MIAAESINCARQYLREAQEYLASAEDNLELGRTTPAAGNAIHAGTSAKDAIVTALIGVTRKAKDHAKAAAELRASLSGRPDAAAAEKALRELVALKAEIEYGTKAPTNGQASTLVRRARLLVDLANEILRPAH